MAERSRTVFVAGDLAPLGRPAGLLAGGDVAQVFGDVVRVVRDGDCFAVNLECPLTTATRRLSKAGPKLKAHPSVAPALKEAGISVVSLANNHIFDYGYDGYAETRASLEQEAIRSFGVGKDAEEAKTPLFVDLDGFRLAFLSYAEHEFNWQGDDQWCTSMLEPADNVLQIQAVARQCDGLVVLLHAGPENWHHPSPRMVKLCRAFAASGASAVLVAHAHAVMGSEYYGGVPIAYGLGNFLFDTGSETPPRSRLGIIARLRFSGRRDVELEAIPIFASAKTGHIDLLANADAERFRRFYQQISLNLARADVIDGHWNAFCASQVSHLRKEVLKGSSAMLLGSVLSRLSCRKARLKPDSCYRKGANLLRGLMLCENHQDVIGRICELLRQDRLREFRDQARRMNEWVDQALDFDVPQL